MEFFVSNAGTVERVWVGGKLWLVANLTMIVPGVLNGSKGALYYPVEECKVSVPRWDGTPIVVRHPSDPITNEPLSADAPGVWQRQGIGVVRSTRFDGKLRAKGWFDAERTERVSPEVHDALLNGRSIELSTGLFTDNHPSPGVDDRGRPYDFIARNYRADHLAILPDQVGACSVRDGCGVLVNAEAGGGRWVTTEGGQHLFLSDEGSLHVSPGGKRVGSDNFVAVVDGKGKVSGREMLRHNLGGKDQSGEMDAAFSQKTEDKFRRAEPEEVDVSSLIATQDKVYKAGLRKKADDDAPVKVARVGGKLLIVDGTHRVVKAMRGGRKSVMAKVVDGEPDRVSNFFSPQEPVMAKSLLERFVNLFSSNAEPARGKDGQFGSQGGNVIDDPNLDDPSDGPIDPLTGEPVFKKGKGSTKNARRCPKCGGEMDEDGECEDCGYTENAGRHLETGQYLPDGAPSGKQVGSAVKKGHGTAAVVKKPALDLDGDEDSDGPSTARNPGNREPMADVDDHDPKGLTGEVKNAMPFPQQPNPQDQPQHQMSKQAAGASLMTEHDPAREHADSAMEASATGDSGEASKFHRKAAGVHEKAATQSRMDGDEQGADRHDQAGALHRKAASMHAATMNANPNHDERGKFSSAGETAAAAKTASGILSKSDHEATRVAMGATQRAHSARTYEDHRHAARMHAAAASDLHEEGNHSTASLHETMSEHHENLADKAASKGRTHNMKITTKSQALKVLTSNCRCEADRAALNNLSEETLLRLANNDGGPAAADGGPSKKSIQAGGEEDDEDNDADDTPGGDMPAVRAKGGKTMNQWMAEAPPEIQSVVANALKVEKAEKRRVASLLVANVGSEVRRKARFKHYMGMALPDLVDVLRDRGQVQNFGPGPSQDAEEEVNLNFLGAAGGMVTDNSSDLGEADILPLPVSNWAEASKENASKQA